VETFADAVAYLTALTDFEARPANAHTTTFLNLDRVHAVLARLGDPHRALRVAHIAGTKGKGSTAAMLGAILRAAGLRVGLFTKPHLISVRERLRVDESLISEAEFLALTRELQPAIAGVARDTGETITFFEAITVMAFLWFARQGVEITVLETGMGGRLDATNVVSPLATAITRIAFDHTAELGHTLAAIAGEKAGIIKPGVPVVSAPQEPEVDAVIAHATAEHHSPLVRVGHEILVEPSALFSPTGQRFSVQGTRHAYRDLTCPLLGEHQQENAAVAIGLAELLMDVGVPISPLDVRRGVAAVQWPGRMQTLREHPLLLLDGAHNTAAAEVLLAALARHFPGRPVHFILGFSRDKSWPAMLGRFAEHAAALTLTTSHTARAVPPDELAAATSHPRAATAPDVATAITQALAHAASQDVICVTGSLYIVGDALRWWEERDEVTR
jgi:dihydrofolate synthase/folylpolyglutamate synthase